MTFYKKKKKIAHILRDCNIFSEEKLHDASHIKLVHR